MSDTLYEGQDIGAGENPAPTSPDDSVQQLARYTIHVPVTDNNHREIPHVLAALRDTLSRSGFPGRTVLRRAQGDWQGDLTSYDTEEMDLVMVDAPDTPENLDAILTAAKGVKELAGQEAVYVTVQPLRTYLV
jgi:hypothetical protein